MMLLSCSVTFNLNLAILLQVTVREVDEEFIYGNYSCRATNQMGVGVHFVEMRRASKYLFTEFKDTFY